MVTLWLSDKQNMRENDPIFPPFMSSHLLPLFRSILIFASFMYTKQYRFFEMSSKSRLTPTAIKEMMISWHQIGKTLKEIADLTGKIPCNSSDNNKEVERYWVYRESVAQRTNFKIHNTLYNRFQLHSFMVHIPFPNSKYPLHPTMLDQHIRFVRFLLSHIHFQWHGLSYYMIII